MEENFRGIILYDIQLNGDLNGIYTNNHRLTQARLFTETAQLRAPIDQAFDDFRTSHTRIYDSFYFDAVDGRVNARLVFTITNGIINAEWFINDEADAKFIGQGYQMNQRQIAIAYTN